MPYGKENAMQVVLKRKPESHPTLGTLKPGTYFVLAQDPTRKLYYRPEALGQLSGWVVVWPCLPVDPGTHMQAVTQVIPVTVDSVELTEV